MSTGSEVLEALAGKDLNKDGKIINLIVCGNSKFYDFSFFEDEMNMWCKYNGYPDVIILGGASGVDYLAERWADNNNIPVAVFTEAWDAPRPNSAEDSGRPEAVADLGDRMMKHATHMLAFPWTSIGLDQAHGSDGQRGRSAGDERPAAYGVISTRHEGNAFPHASSSSR